MRFWQIWNCALESSWGLFSQSDSFFSSFQDSIARINEHSTIHFAHKWEVLGPFQIGTREAVWGSDPLEYYGGFRSLQHDIDKWYASSLGRNGSVTWSKTNAESFSVDQDTASVNIKVSFPDVDWKFLRGIYGWAAMQWQAWIRGQLNLYFQGDQTILLYTSGILELWVNGQHYFGGDFYGFNRTPIVLYLKDGEDRLSLDIRLIRDVRSMGGTDEPAVEVTLRATYGTSDLVKRTFHSHQAYTEEVLVSDFVIDGSTSLGSPHAAVIVRNDSPYDIDVTRIEADHATCTASMDVVPEFGVSRRVVPGQSRPLSFKIECPSGEEGLHLLPIRLTYSSANNESPRELIFEARFRTRQITELQKLTFLHPAGVVSYAMMRPPPKRCDGLSSLPILVVLHGAGVEVDDDGLQDEINGLPLVCAWTLLPTGGTSWSGDDWHQWGSSDVQAAIASLDIWISSVHWEGPKADLGRWFVIGHSNGGQGTWYLLTHHPDRVIAAAPLSGYSSIQNYVPYTFWQSCDPSKIAIIHASLKSYGHELLLENAMGVPLYLQHGESDDNVPAYHSRLLSQRANQVGVHNRYMEYPKQQHWWDGVLSTEPLKDFVASYINATVNETFPASNFTLVTAGHGDMGSKNGIEILNVLTPGQLAKLRVGMNQITMTCTFQTSNVGTFSLPARYRNCSVLLIDGEEHIFDWEGKTNIHIAKESSSWSPDSVLTPVPRRHGSQLGSMDSILRTRGAFQIVQCSPETGQVAVQIARNLFQYFAADSEISDSYQSARLHPDANLISSAVGKDIPQIEPGYTPGIRFVNGQLELIDSDMRITRYHTNDGLAAIYLRPLLRERLELLIWGIDLDSLRLAARLVPLMTGTGQPDFIVLDRNMLWKGLDGVLALGSFDHKWQISRHSFVG